MKLFLLIFIAFAYEANASSSWVAPNCKSVSRLIRTIMDNAKLKPPGFCIPEINIAKPATSTIPKIVIEDTTTPILHGTTTYTNLITTPGATVFKDLRFDLANNKFQTCMSIPSLVLTTNFQTNSVLFGFDILSAGSATATLTDINACTKGDMNKVRTRCGCRWQYSNPETELTIGGVTLNLVLTDQPNMNNILNSAFNSDMGPILDTNKASISTLFNYIVIPYINMLSATISARC